MKKITAIILTLMLVLGLVTVQFAEEAAAPAEGAPATLITVENGEVKNGSIAAGNNVKTLNEGDVVKFGFKGDFDPMIVINFNEPVDTAEYPVLAFKVQRTGEDVEGQVFYNEPGSGAVAGKEKTFEWGETQEWQWIKVDLSDCGTVGYIRFDVFNKPNVETTGMIAAFGFFKTEADVDAFADSGAGKALGSDIGTGSVGEEIIKEEKSFYPLYDTKGTISTGWWFHPYAEGKTLSTSFEIPEWFDRIWIFAYASSTPCPVLLTVLDEHDDEVFSEEVTATGNAEFIVELGKALKPGYYTILIESVEVDDDLIDHIHFVLGSAPASEDVDVEFSNNGGNANDNTPEAPAIKLMICEPDPNYTEKPTATPKPTTAPTEIPTPVPTEAGDEPAVTDAPDVTEGSQQGGKDNNSQGGEKDGKVNTGLIAGIVAGGVVIICVIIAIIAGIKKKTKKSN